MESTSIRVANAIWSRITSSRTGLSPEPSSPSLPVVPSLHLAAFSLHLSAVIVYKIVDAVSDDDLLTLHFLFGKNLEKATRMVDQGGVRKFTAANSHRSLFLVVGESKRKEEYICFPEHHCTCYSFFYDVVNRGEQLCCKHQLAARLAEAVGAQKEVVIPDEQLAVMLSKI